MTRPGPEPDDWTSHPMAELGTDLRSSSNYLAINLAPHSLGAKSDKKYVPTEFGVMNASLQPFVKMARNGSDRFSEVLENWRSRARPSS